MDQSFRSIVSLILKEGLLVKGKKFSNHRYVGDPSNALHIFNEHQADEISLVDPFIGDLMQKKSLHRLEQILSDCFLPVSYGGGLKSIEVIDRIARLGVEKFIFKYGSISSVELLDQVISKYGKQSLVLSYEVRPKKKWFRRELEYDSVGTDFIPFVNNYFGELIIHNVEAEGSKNGVDLSILDSLKLNGLAVPLVFSGGFFSKKDFGLAFADKRIDAVAIGTAFVFTGPFDAVNIGYSRYEV